MAVVFQGRSARRWRRPLRARGFTLTELMIVVAMVGILSAIGIVSFRRQVSSSKTSEAAAVIQAIRAAEEGYRAENQLYLNVSKSKDSWYPQTEDATPRASSWVNASHADFPEWRLLGPRVNQPVQFRYLVNAGRAGETMPALPLDDAPTLGKATDLWYVIQARADADGDKIYCRAAATSMSQDIYFENQGE